MIDWSSIVFFILTILLMGFFAGIEMAFFSANRLTIEVRKKQGGRSGKILSDFIESPDHFLGTTLIGFNLFLVFFGLVLSKVMNHLIWERLHIDSGLVRIVSEITLATIIILIFAEFIPRAIFRARSNTLLSFFAWLINIFYEMFYPIAEGLVELSKWILKILFNVRVNKNKEALKRSDLKNLFLQRINDEEKQERNTQLLENAQELPKTRIRQCLVPRKEIEGIDLQSTMSEVKKKFAETKMSKLIVYDKNIDHINGYIHQLDLFKNPNSLKSILLSIPAVPESMTAADLISKFTRDRKSIAWVVDEFGGTAGIITMEDVLEELFGVIQDEYDTEEFIEKEIAENEYIFSGRLELDYIEEKYGFDFPDNEAETLSGYIIGFHETIPQQNREIRIRKYSGWRTSYKRTLEMCCKLFICFGL